MSTGHEVLHAQRCTQCQASFARYTPDVTVCDTCAGLDWTAAVLRLRAVYVGLIEHDVPKTALSATLHRVIADLDRLLIWHA